VFVPSPDTFNEEYPKVIPKEVDKYISDAASVRKVMVKRYDGRDLLIAIGIA
jgi:hypothetical protein